jgi:hypothetical protein
MKFASVLFTLAAVVAASPWNTPQGTPPCSTSCHTEIQTATTVVWVPTTILSETEVCYTSSIKSEKTTVEVETHTTTVYKPVTTSYVLRIRWSFEEV